MRLRSQIVLDKLFGGLNLFGSFSPDGQEFLVYSENKVSLWEGENGRLIASLPCKGAAFRSRFSYDGKEIVTTCGGDRTARVLDARTGKVILTLSNPTNVASSVFSPGNNTLATTTLGGQVLLWDVNNGQLEKAWQGHGDLISDAEFTPDGKILATVSRDGSTKLWDVNTAKLSGSLRVGSKADYVVFSPDSKLLVVVGEGNKKEIRVWDVASALPVFNITGHLKETFSVEFSADSRLLVSSSDDAVNVWDTINGTRLAKLDKASFPACFSKDGRTLATSGLKGTVILWEVVPR
jgi:WD40 repeat protein